MGKKTDFVLDDWEDLDLSDEPGVVFSTRKRKIVIEGQESREESSKDNSSIKVRLKDSFIEKLMDGKDSDEFTAAEKEFLSNQVADLFELLEIEKDSDRADGVKIYQTDSSPSKPWRYH